MTTPPHTKEEEELNEEELNLWSLYEEIKKRERRAAYLIAEVDRHQDALSAAEEELATVQRDLEGLENEKIMRMKAMEKEHHKEK